MNTLETRVFVSYTQRDGCVTPNMLRAFHEHLSQVCLPFVHFVNRRHSRIFEQFYVFKELIASHVLILIESPLSHKSPWVKLELAVSKLKMMPVIRVSPNDLAGFVEVLS